MSGRHHHSLSARGSRSAHNSNMKTAALNTFVIQAIVQYVLKSFKKPDGEPILQDADINDSINSKFETARRSLNPPQNNVHHVVGISST